MFQKKERIVREEEEALFSDTLPGGDSAPFTFPFTSAAAGVGFGESRLESKY